MEHESLIVCEFAITPIFAVAYGFPIVGHESLIIFESLVTPIFVVVCESLILGANP